MPFVEDAPALSHPAAAVLVRVVPPAATPTSFCQVTGSVGRVVTTLTSVPARVASCTTASVE